MSPPPTSSKSFIFLHIEKDVIKTRVATIIVIAIIGVAINSSVGGLPKTYAGGGIISLVANGAQDVYLTGNATSKLKTDFSKLESHMTKLRSEANPNTNTNTQSGGPTSLVAVPAEDVYQVQSDVAKLKTTENKLQSDEANLQSEVNKTSGH